MSQRITALTTVLALLVASCTRPEASDIETSHGVTGVMCDCGGGCDDCEHERSCTDDCHCTCCPGHGLVIVIGDTVDSFTPHERSYSAPRTAPCPSSYVQRIFRPPRIA